jgi:polysaccharide export outer membrane protein
MIRTLSLLTAFATVLLMGCGGPRMNLADMTAAQPADMQQTGINVTGATVDDYRIGVGDKINVRVFQVPDLSFDELVIDTSGNVHMPLIGAVQGSGRTPGEMAADIAARLSQQYLRDPQVTVTVIEAASQKITVDGAVTKPGVYEMRGATSLLQAVAMAEGPSRVADLSKVAVFRTINGERSVALFDLGAIRQGRAEDPQVLGDDVIVVDASRLNSALREVVTALPALSIFRPF